MKGRKIAFVFLILLEALKLFLNKAITCHPLKKPSNYTSKKPRDTNMFFPFIDHLWRTTFILTTSFVFFFLNSIKIKSYITDESSIAYTSVCCLGTVLPLRQAGCFYLRDCLTCCRIICKCVVNPWSFNHFLICSVARRRVITAVSAAVTIVNMI